MSQNRAASYTRISPDSQQSVMAQLESIHVKGAEILGLWGDVIVYRFRDYRRQ